MKSRVKKYFRYWILKAKKIKGKQASGYLKNQKYKNKSPGEREVDYYSKLKSKAEINKCQIERSKQLKSLEEKFSIEGWEIEYGKEK